SVETAAARLCNDSPGRVTEADIRAVVEARCDDALSRKTKRSRRQRKTTVTVS
ncbi:MAG: hypothetical protein RLZZ574_3085, partial [Cyanobacteriota bacterium]